MVPLLVIAGLIVGYFLMAFIVSGLILRFDEPLNRFFTYAGYKGSPAKTQTDKEKMEDRALLFWGWPLFVLLYACFFFYYLPIAYVRWMEEEKPWLRKPDDDIVEKKPPMWGARDGF